MKIPQQYEHPNPDDPCYDPEDDDLRDTDDVMYLEAGILWDDPYDLCEGEE